MIMEYSDEELLAELGGTELEISTSNSDDDMYKEYSKYKEGSLIANNVYGTVTVGIEELEINDGGANIVCYIRSGQRDEIKLGMYVIVPYPNGDHMFGRISRIRYRHMYPTDDATEVHSERASLEHMDENDYKLIAHIEPICILYKNLKTKLERKMVDRIPKPNSPVIQISDKSHVQIGLNIPTEGLFLGHIAIGGEKILTDSFPPTVPYYLRNDYESGDPLPFRHTIVCGGTGTGKTFLTKDIFRQFIGEDVRYNVRDEKETCQIQPCLVILDPQDEYSQLNESNSTLSSDIIDGLDSEKIKHGGVENTQTFTAKINGENYLGCSSAPITEFTIPFEMVKGNPWLIYGAEMNENQIMGLDKLLDDYFNEDKEPTYKKFIATIRDSEKKAHYTQNDIIHEATYESISRKVDNPQFKRVFDQGAVSITSIIDKIFVPGQVSVFPSGHVASNRIRDLIILAMMTMIVDNKLSTSGTKEIKNVPIILGLDEAHRYLSKTSTTQAKIIVRKFADAARQGRKESLGLFLITQDPQDIDSTIMKQINTKIILNLNNENAINSLMIPREFEKRIPYLKKGQVIVHSPDNSNTVEIAGLKTCVVKHN